MPWLRRKIRESHRGDDPAPKEHQGRDQDRDEPDLLLVHVPRSGGTSLTQSHGVPTRAVEETNSLAHRCGMRMFFYTYYLWETDNYPVFTRWNLFWWTSSVFQHRLALGLGKGTTSLGWLLWALLRFNVVFGVLASAGLSVVFVAPNFGRIPFVRWAHLLMVHYAFCRMMDHPGCLTGMTLRGWLLHLTAHKMLRYGYVRPAEFERALSVAVVRNPYRRMVSLYSYNRYYCCGGWLGAGESFRGFCESWKRTALRAYLADGTVEEWHTPCHAIPQFEYTHFEGVQMVRSIVKHEELGELLRRSSEEERRRRRTTTTTTTKEDTPTLSDMLPKGIREAFVGMPRANQRPTPKPWYEYYDQETVDLVHELYAVDFAVFCYPTGIPERPDLVPPRDAANLAKLGIEAFSPDATLSRTREARSLLLSRAAGSPAERSSMGGFRWRGNGGAEGFDKKHD